MNNGDVFFIIGNIWVVGSVLEDSLFLTILLLLVGCMNYYFAWRSSQ